MTRISRWICLFILFFSLLCIPCISEGLNVEITEVDPFWRPEASTSSEPSIARVDVKITGIDPKDANYKVIQIELRNVTTKKVSAVTALPKI